MALWTLACGDAEPRLAGQEPRATPDHAAIAIPDPYAAEVTEQVLRAGGNAVDATVAAGFALAVTHLTAGNIGGGGFMTVWMDGEAAFLDYRETAPGAAHRDMYLDAEGEVIEGASLIGARAVAVPGTVAGLWEAHSRFGTLPWRELVMPAVELADEGVVLAPALIDKIHQKLDWFGDRTNFRDRFGEITHGARFRQPELATTLRRIALAGPTDFYRGETARLIVEEMARSDGLIELEDLADYRALWRSPLRKQWRGYEVVTAPLPSSGGFALIQLLALKDQLTAEFAGLSHNSPQYIHLVAEIEKRVFADRGEYLGDPDFIDFELERLLADSYLERRASEVDPSAISELGGVEPGLGAAETTHFSIVDRWGNAVSNTTTLNTAFGSGLVVEGAGFLLNSEMDDFSAKPGAPNFFGVVGSTANEIQPGKRPLSSMSPTLLLEGGRVAMVVGTPGGSTIFTSVFQTIVNVLDFGMTPFDSVAAPRFHHQLLPPELITMSISRPLPPQTIDALEQRGYRVEPHSYEFGDVQIIWRRDGTWIAASDPRGRGVSKVVGPAIAEERAAAAN